MDLGTLFFNRYFHKNKAQKEQTLNLGPYTLYRIPCTVLKYFNLFVCACRGIAESDAGSVWVCGQLNFNLNF